MSNFKSANPRTVKFNNLGSGVVGVVTSVAAEPQMTFNDENRPNGPRFDENGNVVLGTVIGLVTADGAQVKIRVGDSIFTDKGREVMRTTSGLAVAIAEGLAAAGASDLMVGDTLEVTYVGDEPVETEGYNPAKIYDVIVTQA